MAQRLSEGAEYMSKQKNAVCPGCSRHCRWDCVRCKYGQRYFEKEKLAEIKHDSDVQGHRKKWEKYVQRGGTLWKFLMVSARCKRALRKEGLTEQMMLRALDQDEQMQLNMLLEKLVRSCAKLDDAPIR